jgi:siderophore synthetase component
MTNQTPTTTPVAHHRPVSRLRASAARSLVAATLTIGGIAGLATLAPAAQAATVTSKPVTTTTITPPVSIASTNLLAAQQMANAQDAQNLQLIAAQTAASAAAQAAQRQAILQNTQTAIFQAQQNAAMQRALAAERSYLAMDKFIRG